MSSAISPIVIPIPVNDPIATPRNRKQYPNPKDKDPNEGLVAPLWNGFFSQQNQAIQAAPARVNVVQLDNQNASIAATDITGANLSGGIYCFWVYAKIAQAASGSSTLTVTIDWRDGGVTCSTNSTDWPVMNGNTTATTQTMVKMIQVDSISPIRYTVARGSVGGTPMLYNLLILLQRVNLG